MKTTRRKALKLGASSIFATFAIRTRKARAANDDRLRIGVMGLSRGMAHIDCYTKIPGVEVAYVCDVDQRRLAAGAKRVSESDSKDVIAVDDFRRILDDPSVDAISIAAPNFWHAPATILACSAGKHVYVEKPGSHNPAESELMVATARRHDRKVQMGVQRRTTPHYIEAIQRLHDGEIGPLRYARCWYDNARGSIGRGKQTPVPDWLNYELWQGPTTDTPYKDNLVHYNWHWHWKWGNGELGNNGVHALDIARWGMQAETPRTVSYNGGRYHFDDDQESPDTGYAVFDFGDFGISWEQSSCVPRRPEKHKFVTFYGDGNSLALDDKGYTIHDEKGAEVKRVEGSIVQQPHFQNFVDAIRNDVPLAAEIATGQSAAMLCHYGNMAYRVGRTLNVDPSTKRVIDDSEAMKLWQRPAYRTGWQPKL